LINSSINVLSIVSDGHQSRNEGTLKKGKRKREKGVDKREGM